MNGSCPCAASQFNQSSFSPSHQSPGSIQSWNDLIIMQPEDPSDLIAWANIASTTVAITLSSTFLQNSWIASPFTLGLTAPVCSARGSDNLQNVADASYWNFSHLTARVGDATVAPPLLKVMFLRGGVQWKNSISLNLGPATYNDLQLSYRDNAATRGDIHNTIPVISFTGGSLTGIITLEVVLKKFGQYAMALRAIDGSSNKSMYEMEWVVVE